MKKLLLSILCVVFILQLNAQKVYATKTGQISFNATGEAVKIMGVNNQVDSKFVEATGQIIFGVLIKAFKFENQLMEDHFNENYMESTQFPKADFKGFITNIKEVNFAKNGDYTIILDGTLTIHCIGKKTVTKGVISIQNGVPVIKCEFAVSLKQYGIKGSYIGDKIASDASIKLNCKY
jgi:hypothetical protein